MIRTTIKGLLLASSILGTAGLAHAEDVTLTIESWRNDDLAIWQEKIIPAFEASHPGIRVTFAPSAHRHHRQIAAQLAEEGARFVLHLIHVD